MSSWDVRIVHVLITLLVASMFWALLAFHIRIQDAKMEPMQERQHEYRVRWWTTFRGSA
jgi:hypothetical protein